MKLSDKGRALLIELEGKSNHVYEDVAGLKTIGVGHLLKPWEPFTELTDQESVGRRFDSSQQHQ